VLYYLPCVGVILHEIRMNLMYFYMNLGCIVFIVKKSHAWKYDMLRKRNSDALGT
jgi:hypothetical protein